MTVVEIFVKLQEKSPINPLTVCTAVSLHPTAIAEKVDLVYLFIFFFFGKEVNKC